MNNSPFRNKKIIILLAVLLLLVVVFLIVEFAVPKDDSKSIGNEPEFDSLLMSDAAGADELSAEHKSIGVEALYNENPDFLSSGLSHHEVVCSIEGFVNQKSFSFVKTDENWHGSDNVQVSNSSLLRLTVNLCNLEYVDKIDAGNADPLSCGINETSSFIRFGNIYGTTVQYTLGNPIPDTDLYYVTASFSDDIFMIDEASVNTVFVSADSYRADNLQKVDFESIQKIYFKNSNCELRLEKGTPDRNKGIYYEWTMTSPYTILARDDMVKSLLITPGAALEAQEYVSDSGDFENYGLGQKENMVIYEDVSGKGQTVYFSKLINNNYYICIDDSPSIYKVSPDVLLFADISTIDVADRALYLVNRSALKSVTIRGEGHSYDIAFGEDNSIVINDFKITDKTKTSNIFQSVCGLHADDVITSVEGEKILDFVFEKKDGTKVYLEFFPSGERYYNVKRNGTPIYTIQRKTINNLFEILDSYSK
ncbi:MAG: DUF4340 domain-containing protein [Clostridia bacterium]|nr:DUF4340 domain-containing protein [Clostridia bacterium]